MSSLTRAQVLHAMSPSPWDLTNRFLYDLCRDYPSHTKETEIIAKVNLLGRAYAAAIERGRTKYLSLTTDRFYIEKVGPKIRQRNIDTWLEQARQERPGTPGSLHMVIKVHRDTTNLFHTISGLHNRSLASKYLHFHLPTHFYIFDSRAQKAVRGFSDILPMARRWNNPYREFAENCSRLTDYCWERLRLRLLPRQLDNLLLYRDTK